MAACGQPVESVCLSKAPLPSLSIYGNGVAKTLFVKVHAIPLHSNHLSFVQINLQLDNSKNIACIAFGSKNANDPKSADHAFATDCSSQTIHPIRHVESKAGTKSLVLTPARVNLLLCDAFGATACKRFQKQNHSYNLSLTICNFRPVTGVYIFSYFSASAVRFTVQQYVG